MSYKCAGVRGTNPRRDGIWEVPAYKEKLMEKRVEIERLEHDLFSSLQTEAFIFLCQALFN